MCGLSWKRCRRTNRLAELVRAELDPGSDVGAGLSNTTGIVQRFLPGPGGFQLGWQLQGQQFRLAVIVNGKARLAGPGNRTKREELVEREYLDFFDFSAMALGRPGGLLGDYRGAKPWLGYNPDFVYRYRPIVPSATWAECVELCFHFSRRTADYVAR